MQSAPPLPRRRRRRVASALIALATLLVVGLSALPAANYALCAAASVACLLGILGLLVLPPLLARLRRRPSATDEHVALAAAAAGDNADDADQDPATVPPSPTGPTTGAGPDAEASTEPTLHYLANAKAALTVVVVLHHAIGAFAGGGSLGLAVGDFYSGFQVLALSVQALNQSWFMCFFFFVSAYFSPASLARKGPRPFLADKFKRLGIPFLAYLLVFGPLLALLVDVAVDRAAAYQFTAAQTWFLLWLLIFNVVYVLLVARPAGGTAGHLVCPLPSVGALCAVGFAVGLVQGAQLVLVPASIVFMPTTFGALPFDILFFLGGILARQNKWLDALASLPPAHVRAAFALVAATSVAFVVGVGMLYAAGGGLGFMPTNACGTPADRGGASVAVGWLVLLLLGLSATFGVFSACTAMAALVLFQRHCNRTSRFARFFSDNAYAVYLVHGWVVVPLTWSYIALVEWVNGVVVADWTFQNNSPDCLSAQGRDAGMLFAGFVYTLILTLLIVYPLAAGLRRIPGVRSVL